MRCLCLFRHNVNRSIVNKYFSSSVACFLLKSSDMYWKYSMQHDFKNFSVKKNRLRAFLVYFLKDFLWILAPYVHYLLIYAAKIFRNLSLYAFKADKIINSCQKLQKDAAHSLHVFLLFEQLFWYHQQKHKLSDQNDSSNHRCYKWKFDVTQLGWVAVQNWQCVSY